MLGFYLGSISHHCQDNPSMFKHPTITPCSTSCAAPYVVQENFLLLRACGCFRRLEAFLWKVAIPAHAVSAESGLELVVQLITWGSAFELWITECWATAWSQADAILVLIIHYTPTTPH